MKKYLFVIFLLVLIIVILNIPLFSYFTISNGKTGEIVYIDSMDNAREFTVSFRHSVNRTPVNEFIRIEGNEFVVYKTTFYSYGAGMPEYDAGSNQKVTIDNGLVQIDNIDRKLKDFTYIVGTYADHSLSYKDKNIKLSTLVKPQNPAFFSISKVSTLEVIKHLMRRI